MPHAHSWVTGPALAVLLAAGSVAAAGSAKGAPPTATPGQALAQGLAAWLSPQALPQDVVSAAVDTVGPQPHTVAALNPGGRLTPGSLAALFSSAAELALLGPGHRLSTQVWIGGRLRHGTVEGNLYLLGQGDPTLTDRSFAQMAAQVAGRIHRVTGALVVDASLLGPPSAPPGWTAQVEETSALPAALAMDQGLATVTLRPGKVGQPVQVSVLPRGALQVQDLATTALHPAQPLAMRVLAGSRLLTVTGGLAPKAKAVVQEVPEASPALVAAGAFLADLRADGVQVAGGVRASSRRTPPPPLAP
jgi:D-alanyl-D-alanine carboxypeptidase/D-alanyl-D-alanine-endopeptidase (penicillin-binding protein 4)